MQGNGEIIMKAIRNLTLAIGLMVISSTSFAVTMSTISTPTVSGSSGLITIVPNDDPLSVFGFLSLTQPSSGLGNGIGDPVDSDGFIYDFYELVIQGSSGDTNVTALSDVTTLTSDGNLLFSIFSDSSLSAMSQIGSTTVGGITALLDLGVTYFLKLASLEERSYEVQISAVPVPAAGILFASALFGAGFLGRRKKKATQSSVIGAFARAA